MADLTALRGESLAAAQTALASFFDCSALARFPEGTAFVLEKGGAALYLARLRLPEAESGVVSFGWEAPPFAPPLPVCAAPVDPVREARLRASHLMAAAKPRAAARGVSVWPVQDPLALDAFRFDLAPAKLRLLCGAAEYRAALENRDRLRAGRAFAEDAEFLPVCILLEGSAGL